jgi:hypothetical protein
MPWRYMRECMHRAMLLDLGHTWRWVVSFMPRPLYPPGKSPEYPFDRRLGEPQSQSGGHGGEKILVPTGTRNEWRDEICTKNFTRRTYFPKHQFHNFGVHSLSMFFAWVCLQCFHSVIGWLMNWKRFGRKWSQPNQSPIPVFACRNWEKP